MGSILLQEGMQLEALNDTSRAAQGGKVGATTCRYSDDNTTTYNDNSGAEAEDSSGKTEDEVVWVKEAQNCNHTCATQKYGAPSAVCVWMSPSLSQSRASPAECVRAE